VLKQLYYDRLEKLPLVDDQDNLVGLITAKDITYKMQRPYATLDAKGSLRVCNSIVSEM
jgi:IMP dehydrogenase